MSFKIKMGTKEPTKIWVIKWLKTLTLVDKGMGQDEPVLCYRKWSQDLHQIIKMWIKGCLKYKLSKELILPSRFF